MISHHECKIKGQKLFLFTTQSGGRKESSLWIRRNLVSWRVRLAGRPGLSSASHTITEAQKLFLSGLLTSWGDKSNWKLFSFSLSLFFKTKNRRKCVRKDSTEKLASAQPDHVTESIAISLELILLVRLIIRAINFSFLLFLIPDQGVEVVVVKSLWRRPINGKHRAATGWYRHQ